jgi:hypothetical protein
MKSVDVKYKFDYPNNLVRFFYSNNKGRVCQTVGLRDVLSIGINNIINSIKYENNNI